MDETNLGPLDLHLFNEGAHFNLARHLGVSADDCLRGLQAFQGLPHRIGPGGERAGCDHLIEAQPRTGGRWRSRQ